MPVISIHAPTWGATDKTGIKYFLRSNFNPRTHMGCDYRLAARLGKYWYFNPRTHMGCDDCVPVGDLSRRISIHAPTWGATVYSLYGSGGSLFQSTHPHGVRLIKPALNTSCVPISIHAPTWGATLLSLWSVYSCENFNPRTHMGCDRVYILPKAVNP